MTDQNEAVGAEALEPVQVGGEVVETPQPEENPESEPAPEAGDEEGTQPESGEADGKPDEGDKPKKKGGFQRQIEKRDADIDKLTREKYEAELRAQQFQRELEAERVKKAAQADDLGEEPKLDSGKYKTVEEWQSAYSDWAKKSARKETSEQVRQEQERQRTEQEVLAKRAAFQAREAQFQQKAPDYSSTVAPFGKILLDSNPAVSRYIAEDAMGPEMAYHLAKNPAVLFEIAQIDDPYAAGRKLLELEARLKAPPPSKQVTKAPDPVKPVGARESVKKGLLDLAQGDLAGYIERRNRQDRAMRNIKE